MGLAVLGLLSEAAGERPLVCLVDDQQWLDRASAQALGFAARRLAADPVGLVFAARVPGQDVAGLPELVVGGGLAEGDARELLKSVLTGPLDARVRDRIIADAHGNPLALLELPRGLERAQLTGGFGVSAVPLDGRIEESFARQLAALPGRPGGWCSWRRPSVRRSGAGVAGGGAARDRRRGGGAAASAGLAEFGARVRFRHPLVRSAAYRSASVQTRQELHAALAEVTDPAVDPDRRAWHRAQAAAGPDEDVAAELEQCAGRAQRRGGLAAAAAFLERSAGLTLDPARRAQRALAAAQAELQAGALDAALGLLAIAQAGSLDQLASARVDLLRGQIAFASSLGSDAPAAVAQGRQAARVARPGPGARDLSERVDGRAVRRAFRGCRRSDGGLPRRPGPGHGPLAARRPPWCSTPSRCWSRTDLSPRHRPCGKSPASLPATASPPKRSSGGAGWRERPPVPVWDDVGWRAMLAAASPARS